ncbi:30S ribosomal protein S15 [Helicobacter sp.]|uniref:30S ribosomal protein S15 n=1 Tax=Helicobacter sp. TaxID=218 RepID=UPI0025BDBE44|nr:30S ribosomal protein S15 [Helicobacter sp.]MCI5968129.1 30S ribosomal protein S15 [Helicobacter sp.]MDY2585424.1 30S ribosomal protein S15 [Helicobacter sp.]
MAQDSAKKREIVSAFARNPKDTGSTEVQVALLSDRIKSLTEHLKANKKDHSSRLGLRKLVSQRKGLLSYLRRTDFKRYASLIEKLGLKDRG